jgi:hypothetical protein
VRRTVLRCRLGIKQRFRSFDGSAKNDGYDAITIRDLAEATGLDPVATANELDRPVDDGYLAGEFHKTLTGGDPNPWFLMPKRLTEKVLDEYHGGFSGLRALDRTQCWRTRLTG